MNENPTLQMLGRRMERLFYVGMFLMAAAFGELYLATANLQFSQDRSFTGVNALLTRIQDDQQRLETIFNTKPAPVVAPKAAPRPAPRPDPTISADRRQQLASTREKLGLPVRSPRPLIPEPPPPPPPPPSPPPPPVVTYEGALNELIDAAWLESRAEATELSPFRDPTVAPAELIKRLQEMKTSIENQPQSVWGIQTPRLVNVEYGGIDYRLPYSFLSTLLAAILPPLVVAWFGSLYMTRQRELFQILDVDDFKLVFPHILNLIPVTFPKLTPEAPPWFDRVNIVMQTIWRIVIVLILIAPILYAHCSALLLLATADNGSLRWVMYPSMFFSGVLFFQTLAFIGQEGVALKTKKFVEE